MENGNEEPKLPFDAGTPAGQAAIDRIEGQNAKVRAADQTQNTPHLPMSGPVSIQPGETKNLGLKPGDEDAFNGFFPGRKQPVKYSDGSPTQFGLDAESRALPNGSEITQSDQRDQEGSSKLSPKAQEFILKLVPLALIVAIAAAGVTMYLEKNQKDKESASAKPPPTVEEPALPGDTETPGYNEPATSDNQGAYHTGGVDVRLGGRVLDTPNYHPELWRDGGESENTSGEAGTEELSAEPSYDVDVSEDEAYRRDKEKFGDVIDGN